MSWSGPVDTRMRIRSLGRFVMRLPETSVRWFWQRAERDSAEGRPQSLQGLYEVVIDPCEETRTVRRRARDTGVEPRLIRVLPWSERCSAWASALFNRKPLLRSSGALLALSLSATADCLLAPASGQPAAQLHQEALPAKPPRLAVPASPAAVDRVPGTGDLGHWLGLPADSPWRLGGVWAGNGTSQIAGGASNPGGPGLAQQFLLDLSLDLERSIGWSGASVSVQGLQLDANLTAAQASGSLQGSNSLVAPAPLDRIELYSYILNQFLLEKQILVRVGQLTPSTDFANVVVPVAESFGSRYRVPGISSLTYIPLYTIPTLLGRLPGYPNSQFGASLFLKPKGLRTRSGLKLGVFDGRGGSGVVAPVQTGLVLPSLSGPLFSVAELDRIWSVGKMAMPGSASVGLWHQGGPLGCDGSGTSCAESSAVGGYVMAQQRLLNFRYPTDSSGLCSFVQLGWSPSLTNLFTSSIGTGVTMFAPMRSRPQDSYGLGLSWARINPSGPLAATSNDSELMLQAYGQFHLVANLFLSPSITVLPSLGLRSATAPSTSALVQLVALF